MMTVPLPFGCFREGLLSRASIKLKTADEIQNRNQHESVQVFTLIEKSTPDCDGS